MFFFFSSRRRHTRYWRDWSSDVCSSDLQRQDEWIGLADNHPDLFERAKKYEKVDTATGKRFTWVRGMPLDEVLESRKQILRGDNRPAGTVEGSWQIQLAADDSDEGCLICTL